MRNIEIVGAGGKDVGVDVCSSYVLPAYSVHSMECSHIVRPPFLSILRQIVMECLEFGSQMWQWPPRLPRRLDKDSLQSPFSLPIALFDARERETPRLQPPIPWTSKIGSSGDSRRHFVYAHLVIL